jgi:hypothetical protein
MAGYTGPNNRRYETRRRWLGLSVLGASLLGACGAALAWLRRRKKS